MEKILVAGKGGPEIDLALKTLKRHSDEVFMVITDGYDVEENKFPMDKLEANGVRWENIKIHNFHKHPDEVLSGKLKKDKSQTDRKRGKKGKLKKQWE